MKKKVLCLLLVLALSVGLLPMAAQAADGVTTVEVTVRSQMAGGYLHAFDAPVSVSSDLAERYGYADTVNGVSALDALVKAHELIFGEAFTPETAGEYLVVPEGGFVSRLFGVDTYASGFFLNEGYPNDGTQSDYGGYNGTTVTTQQIVTGDTVDFFCYQDESYYSDYYSWVFLPESANEDGTLTVTVKGVMAVGGYLYATPEAMLAAAEPLEEVGLGWVDDTTGAVTPIDGLLTDANGQAVVTVAENENRSLVALSDPDFTYVIMNPSSKVVTQPKEQTVTFEVTPSDAIVRVYDPAGAVLAPNADGSYTGMFSEGVYTYTVTKTGYVAATGELPAAGGVVQVALVQAPAGTTGSVSAYWPSFRGNSANMGITDAPLPRGNAIVKWSLKLGSGWSKNPSVQIIADNALILMCGQEIYKLDLQTGAVLAKGDMVAAPNFGYIAPTYADGMIFCPLGKGRVQAFDVKTLQSLWVYTDPLGGQALNPITYADGYIYTGFWNKEAEKANFVCLSVTDEDPTAQDEAKIASWRHTQLGGFYWAGAVVVGDAVIVGTDDGAGGSSGDSTVYAFHKTTGAVLSSLTLTGAGDQRSSMAYDAESGKVFFTTKGGYLCSAKVSNGILSDLKMVQNSMQSTSTPVVYQGKVYYGATGIGGDSKLKGLVVADAESLAMLYSVEMKGYPQCSMLLTTAYEKTDGYLYLYSTYNANPGGITMVRLDPKATTADGAVLTELYDAAGMEQYCICNLICGSDGTLYYKNDSGNVIAVAEAPKEPEEPTDPTDPSQPEEPTDPSKPEDPTDPSKPEEPTDPSKPEEPTKPSDVPHTGDDSALPLMLLLMLASAAGLVWVYQKKRV